MVKLETGRGPWVESGDRWLGRSESGVWQAGTSKVVAPYLGQLRTDGLALLSKY
jgi:hypothetical protein